MSALMSEDWITRHRITVDDLDRMVEVGILSADARVELIEGIIIDRASLGSRRITVDEYYRMAEAGILAEDARVELIEGEIIDMAPIGTLHGGTVVQLNELLIDAVGKQAQIVSQSPLRLSSFSEPEPDFLVVKRRADSYKNRHPTAGDTFLVIEVSDSSLRYDVQVKAPLYARHGIPEYWVVDLPGRQIRFFRSPNSDQYDDVTSTSTPGVVTPVELPGVQIDLTRVLDDVS